MAKALGGEVESYTHNRFHIGKEKIDLVPEFFELSFVEKVFNDPSLWDRVENVSEQVIQQLRTELHSFCLNTVHKDVVSNFP